MTNILKAKMQKAGFTSAADIATIPRLVISLIGLEKQGKTHFSLTAPGPIAFYSTDIGEEGVIDKFKNKEIYVNHIDRVDENAPEQAVAEYDRFYKSYQAMLREKEIRTIVLDTATEIWEILRMARFGRLAQIPAYLYGPVNSEYRSLVRDAYNHTKNLILLHKMKKQYVGKGKEALWNGEYERAGFNDTGGLVQVNAQVYRYSKDDGGDFVFFVRDCRQNSSLAGEEFPGAMCCFPFVAQMVLPEVDPKYWR